MKKESQEQPVVYYQQQQQRYEGLPEDNDYEYDLMATLTGTTRTTGSSSSSSGLLLQRHQRSGGGLGDANATVEIGLATTSTTTMDEGGTTITIGGGHLQQQQQQQQPTKQQQQKQPKQYGSCDFCRRRHITCVGRPTCSNCSIRNQPCVFTPKRKPGPPPLPNSQNGKKRAREAKLLAVSAMSSEVDFPSQLLEDEGYQVQASPDAGLALQHSPRATAISGGGADDSSNYRRSSSACSSSSSSSMVEYTPAPSPRMDSMLESWSALVPYRDYIDFFQSRFKGPKFGLTNNLLCEVPSLDCLLPLASSTPEGRLKQMFLYAAMSVAANSPEFVNKQHSSFFAEEAFRLYKVHEAEMCLRESDAGAIPQKRLRMTGEGQDGTGLPGTLAVKGGSSGAIVLASPMNLQREIDSCFWLWSTITVLAIYSFMTTNITRGSYLFLARIRYCLHLLDSVTETLCSTSDSDPLPVPLSTVERLHNIFAFAFAAVLSLAVEPDRIKHRERMLRLQSLDPSVKLWCICCFLKDDLFEITSSPTITDEERKSKLDRLSMMLMDGEEMLSQLSSTTSTSTEGDDFNLRGSVNLLNICFQGFKGVVSWLLGHRNSSILQLNSALAEFRNIPRPAVFSALFSNYPTVLVFIAKIFKIIGNQEPYEEIVGILKELAPYLPLLDIFVRDIESSHVTPQGRPSWFPTIHTLFTNIRQQTQCAPATVPQSFYQLDAFLSRRRFLSESHSPSPASSLGSATVASPSSSASTSVGFSPDVGGGIGVGSRYRIDYDQPELHASGFVPELCYDEFSAPEAAASSASTSMDALGRSILKTSFGSFPFENGGGDDVVENRGITITDTGDLASLVSSLASGTSHPFFEFDGFS